MTMPAWIIEKLTGKDDLERVAGKGDLALLNACLKTRPLLIPVRPTRFLDASDFTQDQLIELTEQGVEDLSGEEYDLWILEIEGKNRLPVFSSIKKMECFSCRMSQDLNKVFSLGCIEVRLADILKDVDIDFVDLNLFSKSSWELPAAELE